MSKNFGGRGRGWLNLNKNNIPPGNPSKPTLPVGSPPSNVIQVTSEEKLFIDAPEYTDLVDIVKKLSIDDDGIQFNQKIRCLLEKWKEDCPTGEDVEKSFDSIYQSCLKDEELASKLVYMISSRTFISQEVQNKNIRLLFLSQLQQNFDGSELLHKKNPAAFRNCVRMLGEFYNKGRMVNGDPFPFLAVPLVENLQMLLESAQPQDMQLLVTQMFMNGTSIKSECPEQYNKLMNDARAMLIKRVEIPQESRVWLMLYIDGANNRFGLLPAEIYKFYQDNIGEASVANLQGTPSVLSVQTSQNNKTLDSYQSNVNVLVTTTPLDTSAEHSSLFSASDSQGYVSGFASSDTSTNQNSSANFSDASSLGVARPGRPILGVGARLNRGKPESRGGPTWRDGNGGGGGWGGKPKGMWSDGKKGPNASKGWEHDDRFDNDYS